MWWKCRGENLSSSLQDLFGRSKCSKHFSPANAAEPLAKVSHTFSPAIYVPCVQHINSFYELLQTFLDCSKFSKHSLKLHNSVLCHTLRKHKIRPLVCNFITHEVRVPRILNCWERMCTCRL